MGGRKLLFVIAAVATFGVGIYEAVAAHYCVASNVNYDPPPGLYKYRINYGSLGRLQFNPTPSNKQSKAKQAIIHALETWNEQANSGYFDYIGSTTLEDLPETKSACDSQGITYSIVVSLENQSNSFADGECYENGKATQWRIVMNAAEGGDDTKYFLESEPPPPYSPSERDFTRNVIHEAGHTLNLGDFPGSYGTNPSSVMSYVYCCEHTKSRDLWQYDIWCANYHNGDRDVSGYYNLQYSDGSFSSQWKFTSTWDMQKAGAGATYNSSNSFIEWNGIVKDDGYTRWLEDLDPSDYTNISLNNQGVYGPINPRQTVFRDYSSSAQRVIYTDYHDTPTNYSWSSTHSVFETMWYYYYPSLQYKYTLNHCTDMSSFMVCNGETAVKSMKSVSTAYEDSYFLDDEVSVVAWSNDNRARSDSADEDESREIWLTAGVIDHNTLPEPTQTGIRSRVGPGVACNDLCYLCDWCILAYVDENAADGLAKVKRFYVTEGTEKYDITFDSTEYTISTAAYTGSNITAWYNTATDRFYVAIKYAGYTSGSNNVKVYKSQYGNSWSYVGIVAETITGPSAVGYHLGSNNILVTTK